MFGMKWLRKKPPVEVVKDTEHPQTSEIGRRATPEDSIRYMYRQFWVDAETRAVIMDIRNMDRKDGRVKRIHNRTARDAVKNGLILTCKDKRVRRAWADFERRCRLTNPQKLKSDARGMFMEGNLAFQWVLANDGHIVSGLRMPADTIVPVVTKNGVFEDPAKAYRQVDLMSGQTLAEFALFQMSLGRMDPDNYDDQGCMGRPYLDASREVWKKLRMTEEDLVIRRRQRAPQRTAHLLKGMTDEHVDAYIQRNEEDMTSITTDFYVRGDGDVKAITGDANLDQIADVSYLLDTFFSGAPAPKGLFGYDDGLARDILEDLKKDYFEEVDALQDTQASVYRQGFELELLFAGINPNDVDMDLSFAERKTETPNQTTDRALKWQALGAPNDEIWRMLGKDPDQIRDQLEEQNKRHDPYPQPEAMNPKPGQRVSITPGNAPKGESATAITNR